MWLTRPCFKMEDLLRNSKNLPDFFDLTIMDENRVLFGSETKKVFRDYKMETPKSRCIDELCQMEA